MSNPTATAHRRNKMKAIVIIAIAIVAIVAVFGISYLVRVNNYQSYVSSLAIGNPPIQHLADGVYEGACDADIIGATVSVSVANGRIVDVDILEHRTERGQAAEVIADSIVKEQRVDIDAVSGATNSSKVIQKAVENALSQ